MHFLVMSPFLHDLIVMSLVDYYSSLTYTIGTWLLDSKLSTCCN